MAAPSSYYRVLKGPLYTGTSATVGPWSPKLQHGGPPCALIARALEREAAKVDLPFVNRLTIHFFRPVKVAALLQVVAAPIRVGNKVAHFEASMFALEQDPNDASKPPEKVELLRATAISVAPRSVALPAPPPNLVLYPPKPVPVTEDAVGSSFTSSFGYARSVETRCVDGVHSEGPTHMWARVATALVDRVSSPRQSV